mgnify:CR=1 FL=1
MTTDIPNTGVSAFRSRHRWVRWALFALLSAGCVAQQADLKQTERNLQQRIKQIDKDIVTIIITAYAAVDTAIQALKDGAFDYIQKPFKPREILKLVRKAMEKLSLVLENRLLQERIKDFQKVEKIVGRSPAMQEIFATIMRVAPSRARCTRRSPTRTVTTAGESHGAALVAIVDGCPPGLELSEADLQRDLDRRKPGSSRGNSRNERWNPLGAKRSLRKLLKVESYML